MGELSKKAVPTNALTLSSLILFVVVILNYVMPSKIFDIISTVSTICFVIVWLFIMAAHLRYRQQNKNNLGEFRMPAYPLTSWITIIFYLFVLVILFYIKSTRLPLIISLVFLLALYLIYSLFIKTRKNES